MTLLRLLLLIMMFILAIIALVRILQRQSRIKRVWPVKEPEYRRYIEEKTDQSIRQTIEIPVSPSTDFQADFVLWVAFTPDHIAYIVKDDVANNPNLTVSLQRKDETVITERSKRFKSTLAILKRNEYQADEVGELFIMLTQQNYELFRQHIRIRPKQK